MIAGSADTVVVRVSGRSAKAVEADINRVARDATRERQRPESLGELAPIPAAVGVADWGRAQAAT